MNEKKELILDEAMKLFSLKGYYGVGINELLTNCHIPKGSFYHYFPEEKNQLATEVCHRCYELMEEGIKKNYCNGKSVLELFTNMVDGLSRHIPYDPHNQQHYYFSLLLLSFMGIESVYMNNELAQEMKLIYSKWQAFYQEQFLHFGYDQKEAEQYAQVLFTLIHGSLISSWIKQDTGDLMKIREFLPIILSR